MKIKHFFALLVVSAMAFTSNSAKADGSINFFTFNGNTAFGQVYLPGTSTSVDSSFLGQIYVSSTLNGTYTAVGSPLAFQGGGVGQPSAINSGTPVTVPGTFGGDTVFYKIAAWNSSSGATFEQASSSGTAILGMSSGTSLLLGGVPSGGGSALPAPQANTFTSFQLAAVPEPTTVALAVMGGLGLLARRRRNQA